MIYEMTWRFESDNDEKAEEIAEMLRSMLPDRVKQIRLTRVMSDE